MKRAALEAELIRELEKLEIIDCHEHLGPEAGRIGQDVDVFTLFSHYTSGDLGVAGMSPDEYRSLTDRDIPLARRWETFEPYWERIRWGSYARAALLAARKFYGADDINRDTCEAISQAIRANNTPGLYRRVLHDACGIRTCLTQCGSTNTGDRELLTPVMPLLWAVDTWQGLIESPVAAGQAIETFDDYEQALQAYVARVKAEGAVGLKVMANPFQPPDRKAAAVDFECLKSGAVKRLPGGSALRDTVVDRMISLATEHDLVVCVHTGYWGDFRDLDPQHMIPVLMRHPEARFDIYHVGYPYVREALMLGKGFGNVWLNFCWTHIISQRFATDALDEAMDLVPMNKILAFGGDYGLPVEKAYGHLVMAREDVARVLAGRIERGQMSRSQALHLATMWFRDNAVDLYGLTM